VTVFIKHMAHRIQQTLDGHFKLHPANTPIQVKKEEGIDRCPTWTLVDQVGADNGVSSESDAKHLGKDFPNFTELQGVGSVSGLADGAFGGTSTVAPHGEYMSTALTRIECHVQDLTRALMSETANQVTHAEQELHRNKELLSSIGRQVQELIQKLQFNPARDDDSGTSVCEEVLVQFRTASRGGASPSPPKMTGETPISNSKPFDPHDRGGNVREGSNAIDGPFGDAVSAAISANVRGSCAESPEILSGKRLFQV